MAARICRDFYDLAEIPADFRMVDETDAAILAADWFEVAVSRIEPEVVRALGYTWLRDALRELFKDPPAAEQATPLDAAMAGHITRTLQETKGRIAGPHGAARRLDINPHTLRARMRKLGIDWRGHRDPRRRVHDL